MPFLPKHERIASVELCDTPTNLISIYSVLLGSRVAGLGRVSIVCGGRFCADCKHNVVTAFDILTCKCDLADIDNEDEFLPDLFWPFAGRIGPVPGDVTGQRALLTCPLEVRARLPLLSCVLSWCGVQSFSCGAMFPIVGSSR